MALNPAPIPASEGLRAAAAAVVKWQVRVDAARNNDAPIGIVPRQVIGLTGSVCGETLLRSVVPFAMHESTLVQPSEPAAVPLELLLGDSWRWAPEHVHPEERDHLQQWLSHPDRSKRNQLDAASYAGFPALGIYWAHEGKNRVRFLRDCGHTHVPAHLTLYAYPSAERIELFRVQVAGRNELWAVLDRRWVQPILLNDLGEKLLREYGVGPPTRWPANWPDTASVAGELYRDQDPEWQGPSDRVDLYPLERRRLRAVRGREKARASILDLEHVGLRWKYLGKLALLDVAIAVLGRLMGSDSGTALMGLGIGFGVALLSLLSWPLLQTERSMLKPSAEEIRKQDEVCLEAPRLSISARDSRNFPLD